MSCFGVPLGACVDWWVTFLGAIAQKLQNAVSKGFTDKHKQTLKDYSMSETQLPRLS